MMYYHGIAGLCYVMVVLSVLLNSRDPFVHTLNGCFIDSEAVIWLSQCWWNKRDKYDRQNLVHNKWL